MGFLSIFGFIFKDWRVILALIITVIVGVIYWQFKHLESKLADAQQAMKTEQANNAVLRGNLNDASKINQQNAVVIDQLKADKEAATAAVNNLNIAITATNRAVGSIKSKIDLMTEPPKPMSPYIIEAIRSSQELQDAETPPPRADGPPKTNSKTVVMAPPPAAAPGKKAVSIPK